MSKPNDTNIDENGFTHYPKWVDTAEIDQKETDRTTVKGKPVVTKYVRVLVQNEEEEAEVSKPAGWTK